MAVRLLRRLSSVKRPPKVCRFCGDAIKTNDDSIRCHLCNKWFHLSCKDRTVVHQNQHTLTEPLCSRECVEKRDNKKVALDRQLSKLADEIGQLRQEVNFLQQQRLENNVLVVGIPYVKGEHLLKIFERILTAIGRQFDPLLVDLTRHPSKSQTIRLSFLKSGDRRAFLAAILAHGPLLLQEVWDANCECHSKGVLILEIKTELTPFYEKLVTNARQFKKLHNFRFFTWYCDVEITLKGPVDAKTGMVMNITDLKEYIDAAIMKPLDHKNLDLDVEHFKKVPSTTENLAVYIWENLKFKMPKPELLFEVKLYETDKNSVVYRGQHQNGLQYARMERRISEKCIANLSSDSES